MNWMNFLNKLNKREKYAVYLGLLFIVIYIVIELIVVPAMEKRERLERILNTKLKVLEEMQALQAEYHILKDDTERFKRYFVNRPKSFTLFSFLDKLAGQANVKDNIAYMKPSKSKPKDSPYTLSKVEMKIQKITIKQLTPYLHMIETSKNMIFIRRLSVTKAGKEGFIDAVLQVEAFEA